MRYKAKRITNDGKVAELVPTLTQHNATVNDDGMESAEAKNSRVDSTYRMRSEQDANATVSAPTPDSQKGNTRVIGGGGGGGGGAYNPNAGLTDQQIRRRRQNIRRRLLLETSVASPQPDFANVVWQMNMEQATASALEDQSTHAHTVTYVSGTLETSIYKYGARSIKKLTGSSQAWSIADHASTNIGAQDFSIEAWVYPTLDSADMAIACQWHTSTNRSWIWWLDSVTDTMKFTYSTGGSTITGTVEAAWTWGTNQWYHIAVCRKSGVIRMFVDGEQIGTDAAISDSFYNSTRSLHLMYGNGAEPNFDGHMDEWRMVVGEGIYDANFSVPTTAHPTS